MFPCYILIWILERGGPLNQQNKLPVFQSPFTGKILNWHLTRNLVEKSVKRENITYVIEYTFTPLCGLSSICESIWLSKVIPPKLYPLFFVFILVYFNVNISFIEVYKHTEKHTDMQIQWDSFSCYQYHDQ